MSPSRVFCLLSASLLLAQTATTPAATARRALDLLLGNDFPGFSALLSPSYKASTTQAVFERIQIQIHTWGAVENIGEPAIQDMGPTRLVTIPVSFAGQKINFQFGVNADGQVSTPLMRPGESAWTRPAYVTPGAFKEREITLGDGDIRLPGLLTAPTSGGPSPAVLLVQGFGVRDKDNTHFAVKPFRDLAEGLASRGIVVLRYEKRTHQYPGRFTGKSYTSDDEVVDDAGVALEFLRAQKEVDPKRVFVLGHDLGGYLAPRIADDDGKLSGVIILASNARPLEDSMIENLAALGMPKNALDAARAQAARIKKLEPTDADLPPIFGLPVTYWLDLKDYDAPAETRKLTIPVLVLQGERDFQVPMQEFELWKTGLAGRQNATVRSYPSLDHVFVEGQGKSTEADYKKPGHMAQQVVDDIAAFIKK